MQACEARAAVEGEGGREREREGEREEEEEEQRVLTCFQAFLLLSSSGSRDASLCLSRRLHALCVTILCCNSGTAGGGGADEAGGCESRKRDRKVTCCRQVSEGGRRVRKRASDAGSLTR